MDTFQQLVESATRQVRAECTTPEGVRALADAWVPVVPDITVQDCIEHEALHRVITSSTGRAAFLARGKS